MTLQDRRSDSALAREIDRAILTERTDGAVKTWAILVQLGVSPNAIKRILGMDGLTRRRPVGLD